MQITGLQHDAELDGAFPVIRERHQDLEDDCCRDLIPKTRAAGYRMFAVREEGCGYVAPACGRERRTPPLRRAHGLRAARLLNSQGVDAVTPKPAGCGCPISARNGALRVGQSGS